MSIYIPGTTAPDEELDVKGGSCLVDDGTGIRG